MGKNLIQQRRGRGTSTFRAPSFRYFAKVRNKTFGKESEGKIIDFVNCPGHSAPLALIKFNDGEITTEVAAEGIRVGREVDQKTVLDGNTLALKEIPEGTNIYNIESQPGDGGKFVRSAGSAAKIVAKLDDKAVVLLPSKKTKEFMLECRATIGVIGGGGKTDKPFVKAGNKYFAMKAKNKIYPKVAGTAMNAVAHPFGGSSSHIKGRPTQAPRNAPPGRKVGKLWPRRTGRRKK